MSREYGSVITGEETLMDEDPEEALRRAAAVKGIDVKAMRKEGWAPSPGRGSYEVAAKKRDAFNADQREKQIKADPLGVVEPKPFEDIEHVAGRETPAERRERTEHERKRVKDLRESIKGM